MKQMLLVPVAPLRLAFLASGKSAVQVARAAGWWDGTSGDSSRVKRTLGLLPTVNGAGHRQWRTRVDIDTVELLAGAIGVAPWEVLPDDEEMAA